MQTILIIVATVLISAVVFIPIGVAIRKKIAESKIQSAESEAKRLIENVKIEAENLKRYSWDKGYYVWIEQPDVSTVGEKAGKIQVFPITYPVTVIVKEGNIAEATSAPTQQPSPTTVPVVDSTAPEVITRKVVVYAEDYNAEILVLEQFITEIKDESDYVIHSLTQPEEIKYGHNTVRFLVTDTVGNSTNVETELVIINLKKNV